MSSAVFPGTFSPTTLGHIDIVERAADHFDTLHVAVVSSESAYFTFEERVEMMRAATAHVSNVAVEPFSGLLVDFVERKEIGVIVRAIRDGGDSDFERRLAQMNRQLTGVETFCLMVAPELSYLSSTLIRQIGAGGRRLHGLVPEAIEERVFERLTRGVS